MSGSEIAELHSLSVCDSVLLSFGLISPRSPRDATTFAYPWFGAVFNRPVIFAPTTSGAYVAASSIDQYHKIPSGDVDRGTLIKIISYLYSRHT